MILKDDPIEISDHVASYQRRPPDQLRRRPEKFPTARATRRIFSPNSSPHAGAEAIRNSGGKTDDRIRSHVFLCTLAYYLQWHLKQRLEPLFAADGTHKDREWTMRNVIERLAAIRREKIAMGTVEFEKVTTPEPDQQTILDYLKVRL
jgi:hypothetical protein